MKERAGFITSVAAALVVLFACVAPHATAQGRADSQKLDFTSLTLKISSTKEDFVELEPIPVIFTLRNETARVALGHSALDLSNNFVKLFIVEGDGEAREIENASPVTGNTAASTREIGPGESLEAKQALAFRLDKIFPGPGEYRIQAQLYDAKRNSAIKSNLLTVRIRRPEGPALEALEYIRNSGASSYFFSGTGFPGEKQEREALEDFVARFGGTIYGDYAAFLLGERYFYDKDYKRAGKHFSLLAKRPDFIFAGRAKDYLEKIKKE